MIQYYFVYYNLLHYLLLFLNGVTVWHQGVEGVNRRPISTNDQTTRMIDLLQSESIDDLLKRERQSLNSLTSIIFKICVPNITLYNFLFLILNKKIKNAIVSFCEYYSYNLQIRPNFISLLLCSGRLLEYFDIDMYFKTETSRLDYFHNRQQEIRFDVYQGIVDSILVGESIAIKVGNHIILPSFFIGGPRDMHKKI